MSRKKRKSSKTRAQKRDFRQPPRGADKGKELVDEKVVKAGEIPGASFDDFSEAGYGCDRCDWTTAKRGNAGIQATRAHSKVHVRDRRAVVNTLVVQVAVLVITLMIALSPGFMWIASTTAIGEMRLPDAPVNAELIVAATAAASILFAVAVPFTGDRYFKTGKRRWWSRYTWLVRLLAALMWSVAGLRWLEAGQDIWLPWFTPVLLPWAVWLWIGNDVALTRLAVKRRAFKPRNQRKLLKSKNKITDHRVGLHRLSLKAKIRDGRIVLFRLSRKRLDYFERLGLGKTRLDKRKKQKRLKTAEEARLTAEQRALRARRKRDRRGRRSDESRRRI